MTEIEDLREEIKEIDDQIFRLRGSMNKQDNAVKLHKLAVITRTRDRCSRWLSALERRSAA